MIEHGQKKDKSSTDVFTAFLGCFKELTEAQHLEPSKILVSAVSGWPTCNFVNI